MATKATNKKTKKKQESSARKPSGDHAATATAPLEAAAQAAATPRPEPVTIVDLTASVCPFCRSTNREPYHNTEIIRGPVRISRVTYSRVELRRTKCTDCNRRRIDRSLVPLEDPRVPYEETPGPGS